MVIEWINNIIFFHIFQLFIHQKEKRNTPMNCFLYIKYSDKYSITAGNTYISSDFFSFMNLQ